MIELTWFGALVLVWAGVVGGFVLAGLMHAAHDRIEDDRPGGE